MSRKERVLKKRYAIFCEGDTEYNSYRTLLDAIRKQDKLVSNNYEIKKKTFDIIIKQTNYDQDVLNKRDSNIEEFFDVIDW
ncbi:hypothetical protein [Butyrivibrio sp. NC3005]|uniref:hypothetical protein n=1 Tax=Butyrivibrio sp. NC3005 TaxID=1280685 RepID=UPI00047C4CA7|nr:hypothetical protein [Butyrivibrio sp. NC3005]